MKIFDRFWNKDFGRSGEEVAAAFLKKKGWRILEMNFATERGEIDIIAFDGKQVIFVEVKTRSDAKGVYPEDAVDRGKLSRIIAVGHAYLKSRKLTAYTWRIDIIAVEPVDGKLTVTNHIMGA